MLYHLIALAVLPSTLGGKQACAVIIDCDNTFSVPRLAQQLQLWLSKHAGPAAEDHDDNEQLMEALKHIHIFRPQSLPSTIATLNSLPTYLFNKSIHYSFDRPVGLVAMDSALAFYWQAKAEEEDAALLAATTTDIDLKPTAAPSSYAQLTTALKNVAATFSCPVILTSWHLGPVPTPQPGRGSSVRSLRPSVPAPLSQLPTLRLVVQRMPVRKFPAGISVEEAKRESVDRQRAIEEGEFECVVNEWSVDERTLQKLQQVGAGFRFRVKDEGVIVDAGEGVRWSGLPP